MAAKLIANLIVMGSGIMIRAFAQAYRQALANASKNGVAQEAVNNTIKKAGKTMTEAEARQNVRFSELQSIHLGKRLCRNMINCSRIMQSKGAFTFNLKCIERKNV